MGTGRDAQHAATIQERDNLGEGRQVLGTRRHRLHADHQRVAIRIANVERDVEGLVALHSDVCDGTDNRHAVRVVHRDRHFSDGYRRHVGAVTVIGGGEAHRVDTCLRITGRPREHPSIGVERGAGRQPLDGDIDRAIRSFKQGQRAVLHAVLWNVIGVVGIEGKGAEADRLAFRQRPAIQRIKHRRTVHVQHVNDGTGRDGVFTVSQRELHGEVTRLVVIGCPFELPRQGIEGGAARHAVSTKSQCLTIEVRTREPNPNGVALAHRALGHAAEVRRRIALKHGESDALVDSIDAVCHVEPDVFVDTGLRIARRPVEGRRRRIEHGSRGQVVREIAERIALGIGRGEGECERRTFVDITRAETLPNLWRAVAARDGNREGLHGEAAARVVGA